MQVPNCSLLFPGGFSYLDLWTGTENERDEWITVIRNAKASLLGSLNVTHPNSTLTSSTSTNHLRRSLQALPFHPHDERLDDAGENTVASAKGKKGKGKDKGKGNLERRGRVEHWVPPIWIPDAKTEGCMRCGRGFSWRRRRHHCRLCGRCVCAGCSERVSDYKFSLCSRPALMISPPNYFKQTFFISDSSSKGSTKPARACNACYETVFPLLDLPSDPEAESATVPNSSSSPYNNTITSLTGFPSWLSMPSLPLPTSQTPEALMAIDREPRRVRGLHRIDDDEGSKELSGGGEEGNFVREGSAPDVSVSGRVRMKAIPPRPPSSYDIFEQHLENQRPGSADAGVGAGTPDHEGEESLGAEDDESNWSRNLSSSPSQREDTVRRNKRFSMPAVALQTTSVVARTGVSDGDRDREGASGVRAKRFSLVLSGRTGHGHGHGGTQSDVVGGSGRTGDAESRGKTELGKSVAASRLSELLGRRKA